MHSALPGQSGGVFFVFGYPGTPTDLVQLKSHSADRSEK